MTESLECPGADERHDLVAAAELRLLEIGLGEVCRDRAGSSPAPHVRATGDERWRRLLPAALLLLGCGVVIAMFAVPVGDGEGVPTRQDPAPLPDPVVIEDPTDLASVGRDAVNLELFVEAPDDLLPLAEFGAMRRLKLRPAPHERRDIAAWQSAGAAALDVLARCRALEVLDIGALEGMEPRAAHVVDHLLALRSLELSGSLHLVDAELARRIAKLPLRRLALRGVRVTAGGFAGLCGLPLLEELSLEICLHLDRCELRALGQLRLLRRLVLYGVGSEEADALGRLRPLPGEEPESVPPADGPTSGLPEGHARGLLDRTVAEAICDLPRLRALSLRDAVVDDELLGMLPVQLEELVIDGAHGMTPAGIGRLARLENLTRFGFSNRAVGLAAKDSIDPETRDDLDRVFCNLVGSLSLERVEIRGVVSPGLSAALGRCTSLREVRFTGAGARTIDLGFASALPALETLRLVIAEDVDPAPLAGAGALRTIELRGIDSGSVAAIRDAVGRRGKDAEVRIIELP